MWGTWRAPLGGRRTADQGGAPDAVTSRPARDFRASAVDDPHRAVSVWQAPGRRGLSDPQLVELYRKHGRRTPHHVPGAFAFVLYDPGAGVVLAARDAVGTRPLYYQRISRRRASGLLSRPSPTARSLRPKWIRAGSPPTSKGWHRPRATPPSTVCRSCYPGRCCGARTVTYTPHAGTGSAPLHLRSATRMRRSRRTTRLCAMLPVQTDAPPRLNWASHWRRTFCSRPPPAKVHHATTDSGAWASPISIAPVTRFWKLPGVIAAGADVISGWPGRGTTWRHWVPLRGGCSRAAGVPHGPHVPGAAGLYGRNWTLAAAGRGTTGRSGGSFDLLASRRDATMFHRAARAVRGVGSSLARGAHPRRQASPSGRWQPGPFISPAVAADLGLAQLARAHWQTAAEPPVTGYAAWTEHGLVQGQRERLSTWYLLGPGDGHQRGVPRYSIRRWSLPCCTAEGSMTSRVCRGPRHRRFSHRGQRVDWRARRWPGQERSKTPTRLPLTVPPAAPTFAKSAPTTGSPAEHGRAGPSTRSSGTGRGQRGLRGQRRRQSSVEFAHIEGRQLLARCRGRSHD